MGEFAAQSQYCDRGGTMIGVPFAWPKLRRSTALYCCAFLGYSNSISGVIIVLLSGHDSGIDSK
eukprot:3559468-Ditylum_brightwellii.AAC.1